MTVVLGVDGGGRTTHAVVADQAGSLMGMGFAGGSNWESVGLAEALAHIAAASDAALGEAGIARGDLDASAFGLAGIDWPSDVGRLEGGIAPLGLGGPRRILNDAFVAFRAGAPQAWGVVVVAGTGTIAAGRNPAGEEFRTLGQGRVFGDVGSEFDVSELAVRAVADAYTGRGPSTMLTELLCERTGVDTAIDLLERIARADTRLRSPEVANMTPLVLQATEAGDLVARGILEEVGQALGDTAGLVGSQLAMLDLDFPVVLAGGLFRTPNRYLLDQLELGVRRKAPLAYTVLLDAPPVVGSVLFALELASSPIVAGVGPLLTNAVNRRLVERPR
jgi:N-acetylglucosamine kinase-like BadF-type ATPase